MIGIVCLWVYGRCARYRGWSSRIAADGHRQSGPEIVVGESFVLLLLSHLLQVPFHRGQLRVRHR